MNAVSDGWVRDVVSVDTQNSTTCGHTVRSVTLEQVHIRHTLPFTAAAAPADVAISGTQILLDRSSHGWSVGWAVAWNVTTDYCANGCRDPFTARSRPPPEVSATPFTWAVRGGITTRHIRYTAD